MRTFWTIRASSTLIWFEVVAHSALGILLIGWESGFHYYHCQRAEPFAQHPEPGVDRRQQILDLVSIHFRPPEVEDRLLPGHWEGDLIKGAFNRSAIGILVERVSGLVFLARPLLLIRLGDRSQ
ncbi:Integrase [Marinobacter sp. ELB17]|nr:Integrase [Marinobacter sp. ELB17]